MTTLADKYELTEGRVFSTGVQALARVPLDQRRADARAGLRTATFISGYQGSPLGGYDLEIARAGSVMAAHDVVHRPAVNEELAATAIMGSQLANAFDGARFDGVLGIWYGKGPGLDRATDAIRHANLIGVSATGGVLAAVGDDPASKSSTVPSASEPGLIGPLVPVLCPGDVQEVLDYGLHGFALSRAGGLWCGLKMSTNVADAFQTIEVSPERIVPRIPEVELDGRRFRHTPTARLVPPVPVELERTLHEARLVIAREYGYLNGLNRIEGSRERGAIGIAAPGKTYFDVRQALAALGIDESRLASAGIRLLKVGLAYPIDPRTVREFARGLDELIVVEEKRDLIELFVKEALYAGPDQPPVVGKRDASGAPLFPAHGELDADLIALALARRLERVDGVSAAAERLRTRSRPAAPALPIARTPYFCSGCPHNRSTVVPTGSKVGAGIGCHTMVLLTDSEDVGTYTGLTQMGGEGAQWIGMAPFTETAHVFQNIGDGTLAHSGTLAIRAAVAADANITFKILHNAAVAMTGGQDAAGAMPVPALTQLLRAEGVAKVVVTTEAPARYRGVRLAAGTRVEHRDRLLDVQRELAATPGVTALIHDQECAAEKRRKRKRGLIEDPPERAFINERVCEGCGDCGRASNCLSLHPVDTEFGTKTRIHQASCNKDYSCLDGDCPSFLTVTPGRDAGRAAAPAIEAASLPQPASPEIGDSFCVRVMGIGGTGVVTIAQVLGFAALLDGLLVRGLDQTGLAQKGGPVVSDLKLARAPIALAQKAASGEADLYLGCDLLVASEQRNLAVADPERTVAVISTAAVPTGSMVGKPTVRFPEVQRLTARIAEASRSEGSVQLDAQALAQRLFASDVAANMLLVGAAFQAGALPLSAASIERAIAINGTAVELNVQAFRQGRRAVADPSHTPTEEPPRSLDETVAHRVAELTAYQHARYAQRYADFVADVAERERAALGAVGEVSDAVARNLYKLMAYKDEYEVARLHLDSSLASAVEAEFGPGATVAWRLHPPLLRALGMTRKLTLGAWFRPALRVLRTLRRLRHTPFDVFGYAKVRRTERTLIGEYRELVEHALAQLAADNADIVRDLAELPDMIRGYENVKLASVEAFRTRAGELRAQLDGASSCQPTRDHRPAANAPRAQREPKRTAD